MTDKVIKNSINDFKASIFLVLIASIIIPISFWIIKPDEEIKLSWFVTFVIIMVLINYFLFLLCKNLWIRNKELDEYNQEESNVISIINDSDKPILILKKNANFKVDMLVSIFYLVNLDVEKYLGLGRIFHIQEKGIIQVQILYLNKDISDLFSELQEENSFIKARIKVKPNVNAKFVDDYYLQGD